MSFINTRKRRGPNILPLQITVANLCTKYVIKLANISVTPRLCELYICNSVYDRFTLV